MSRAFARRRPSVVVVNVDEKGKAEVGNVDVETEAREGEDFDVPRVQAQPYYCTVLYCTALLYNAAARARRWHSPALVDRPRAQSKVSLVVIADNQKVQTTSL